MKKPELDGAHWRVLFGLDEETLRFMRTKVKQRRYRGHEMVLRDVVMVHSTRDGKRESDEYTSTVDDLKGWGLIGGAPDGERVRYHITSSGRARVHVERERRKLADAEKRAEMAKRRAAHERQRNTEALAWRTAFTAWVHDVHSRLGVPGLIAALVDGDDGNGLVRVAAPWGFDAREGVTLAEFMAYAEDQLREHRAFMAR